MIKLTCSAPDCDGPRRGRQLLCSKHYQQQWREAQPCDWPGCGKPRIAKELCNVHYRRQRTGADMNAPEYGQRAGTECELPDCYQPHHAGGLCSMHAQRLRRTGDPYGRRRIPTIECTVTGCTSAHMANGLCHRHYEISRRHGSAEPAYACRACGEPFQPSSGETGVHGGSYVYCPLCAQQAPQAYASRAAQLRLRRLRVNNAGMTAADRQDSASYRAVILGDPCVYCGWLGVVVDHIVPVVAGGGDWWTNLAPACRDCNAFKHDRSLLAALLAFSGPRV